jgi:hypothetical protein
MYTSDGIEEILHVLDFDTETAATILEISKLLDYEIFFDL